jgi:eukaryotic-like serine/threonine-protein kinase
MLVGRELGPYVVEKELGSGAMGTVYRARHSKTGAKVAVKVVSPAVVGNEAALARFTREVAILKQLSHPNIVKYFGSGRVHGTPFYIMEYVDGESLDHVMARRDRMTWEEVVALGVPLCGALQYAHDQGIIHRDLKPSNIMVLRDGSVKLTDFGIAKDCDLTALTGANSTVGTAAYMSPEQCRGTRDLTFKSDLYSLGVMYYELITGRKPFIAETAMDMFMKHSNEEAPRPSRLVLDLPIWLDNLICQLMEKKPDQRPYSADAVAKALQAVREKVEAQLSAGVDVAGKRRIDRGKRDTALDESDKNAARALLGKKKKKKKALRFYQKGWFTLASIALVALAFVGGIYFVFVKPPDADRLYQQAEAAMKSGSSTDQRGARKEGGALADFLYYHPNHDKAAQVQKWADQVDAEETESALLARLRVGMKAAAAEEKMYDAASAALRLEEQGRLDDASRSWRELAAYKKEKDADVRSWGLMAEKRLRDLQAVDKLYQRLKDKILVENIDRKQTDPASPAERIALEAIRAERKQQTTAGTLWDELEELTKEKTEQRPYFLLAAQRSRALKVMP